MPFLRRHWPVLTLALLPLVVLWRCVFLGETVGPWDQIMQMAPWGGPKPTSAWDVLQADGVLQFYPWRDLVFSAWSNGRLPLWNPYQLCGTALLANSQSAGFYPPHILVGLLHVPTSLAVTLLAWFHLAWACLGARYLSKQYGANEYGAVLAGASFGLSAFMVSWTPLASVVTTCSWIPWVAGLGKSLVSSSPEDEGEPRRSRTTALLALACAMMLLGGHLQFAAYGFMGLLTIVLVEGVRARSLGSSLALSGLAITLGGMLAAPQVLPALEFSRDSHRQVGPTPEGAAGYAASALGLPELTGFVVPNATGLPGRLATVGGEQTDLPSYWPAYIKRGAAFAEGAIGLGPFVFGLLFFAQWSRVKEGWGAVCLTVLGLLLALGPLSVLLYWVLPGWSATGSPGRAEVLVLLGVATLAAKVWRGDTESMAPGKWRLLGVWAGALMTFVLLAINAGQKPWIPAMESAAALVMPTGEGPLLLIFGPILLAFVAILVFRGSKRPGLAIALAVLSTLLAGPLFCLPSGKPMPNPGPADPNTRIAFVNTNWGLLNAAPAVMPGNTATLARIPDVGGYDSLLNKDTLEMLRSVNSGQDPAPEANGNMMFVKSFDTDRLIEAGVAEVWSNRLLPRLGESPEIRHGVYVYRLEGPGRAFVTRGPMTSAATITLDGTDRQTVVATGPGTLVVRDRNMPGWTVTVGGKPAVIKPGFWREVELPAGGQEVDFRYSPPGLGNGVLASIVGALVTGLMLLWHRLATKRL